MAQCTGDVILADELGEFLRPVLPLQAVRRHEATLPTPTSLAEARSRGVGSGATCAREPSQVRKEAALSGNARVPPGRLMHAASGPLVSRLPGGMRERPNRHAWKACEGQPSV